MLLGWREDVNRGDPSIHRSTGIGIVIDIEIRKADCDTDSDSEKKLE